MHSEELPQLVDKSLASVEHSCYGSLAMNHTRPASVIYRNICCFQLCSILISFIVQRIMVRSANQCRRYIGQALPAAGATDRPQFRTRNSPGGSASGRIWVAQKPAMPFRRSIQ
jgi:hypothetical protein